MLAMEAAIDLKNPSGWSSSLTLISMVLTTICSNYSLIPSNWLSTTSEVSMVLVRGCPCSVCCYIFERRLPW